ncbi:MAG: hypothetical protein ACR2OJ_08350 [Hyphomicrobiales bacterium]
MNEPLRKGSEDLGYKVIITNGNGMFLPHDPNPHVMHIPQAQGLSTESPALKLALQI